MLAKMLNKLKIKKEKTYYVIELVPSSPKRKEMEYEELICKSNYETVIYFPFFILKYSNKCFLKSSDDHPMKTSLMCLSEYH